MTTTQGLLTRITSLQSVASQALNAEASEPFEAFDREIRAIESGARETLQAKVKREHQAFLDKLEQGRPLTQEEMEVVRLLVVGAAKYYLQYENDLQNWRDELGRLADEIAETEATMLDSYDNLLHLQALCHEARNVLPEITNYYREKERVRRFEAAAGGAYDAEAGQILADVIRSMMESDQM